jgi:hypothetical protein
MNIFATDDCPFKAAYALPDKLVIKMSLENAQLLAACFSEEFLNYGGLHKKDGGFYAVTHKNHPCSKWVRESKENVAWTIVHGLAICAEYHRRYGKIHCCLQAHLDAKRLFEQNGGSLQMYREHTPFVRAMFDEFKLDTTITTVEAYRRFMHTKHYAKWKHNNEPNWWNHEHHDVQRSLQVA